MGLTDKMHASVVIPAYNCAKTIGVQLGALQKQDFRENFEVIVADNGSTDDTESVIGQYTGLIKNLKIIKANKKRGAGYARNRGVDAAQSEIILFCDADDKVSYSWITQMEKALKNHQIVAPRMEHFEISEHRFANIKRNMQTNGLLNTDFKPSMPFAGASGLGVQKDLHKRISGFDELFLAGEDWDYCWKAQLEAKAILAFNPDALIQIRHRGSTYKLIKQAMFWGTYYPMIEKKYKKHGLISPNFNDIIFKYKKKIVNLDRINDPVWRDRLVWSLSHDLGKLKGYLKFRHIEF